MKVLYRKPGCILVIIGQKVLEYVRRNNDTKFLFIHLVDLDDLYGFVTLTIHISQPVRSMAVKLIHSYYICTKKIKRN